MSGAEVCEQLSLCGQILSGDEEAYYDVDSVISHQLSMLLGIALKMYTNKLIST